MIPRAPYYITFISCKFDLKGLLKSGVFPHLIQNHITNIYVSFKALANYVIEHVAPSIAGSIGLTFANASPTPTIGPMGLAIWD